MQPSDLRVALFSGNYNYVRDGANQALNLLVEYLLGQGVAVRVYSPTTDTPAFEARGDLDDVPEEVREAMTFHFAMTIDEVLSVALEPAKTQSAAA